MIQEHNVPFLQILGKKKHIILLRLSSGAAAAVVCVKHFVPQGRQLTSVRSWIQNFVFDKNTNPPLYWVHLYLL